MAETKRTMKVESNPDHRLIEESTIENNPKKGGNFFTTKKVVLMSLFFVLTIVILFLTIRFIMGVNFKQLASAVDRGFGEDLAALWLTLLISYIFYAIFCNFATFWIRLRKLGYKIPFWEYWLFGASYSFLKAITPILFSDPYALFWLKTKGISTSRATSLLFSNVLFWQIIQFLVTLPSFIIVLVNRNLLFDDPEGITAFTFLCLGIITDACCIAIMLMLNLSKKMHSGLSKIFNWFKKKFHMKYHSKAEIEEKYKNQATIKRDFIGYLKDWKTTSLLISIYVVNELYTYFAVCWSLYFVQFQMVGSTLFEMTFDFWGAFNSANVCFTANRLNFITPNGEGSIQALLYVYLDKIGNLNVIEVNGANASVKESGINNSILLWRMFNAYFPAILGLMCMVGLTTKQVRDYKKYKHIIG